MSDTKIVSVVSPVCGELVLEVPAEAYPKIISQGWMKLKWRGELLQVHVKTENSNQHLN
jgi:hypothetical protein